MGRFYYSKTIEKNMCNGGHIETTEVKFSKTETEPEYIKLYFKTISVIGGVSQSYGAVLMELCKLLDYAKDGGLIHANKYSKKKIAETLGITVNRVDCSLSKLCKAGILQRVEIGTYRANPDLIARGKWADIVNIKKAYVDFEHRKISQRRNDYSRN